MRRSTLKDFIRGLVIATLPLAAACGSTTGGNPDAGDAAVGPVDATGDQLDMCITMPVITRSFPYAGDGGAPSCATACEPGRPAGYLGFATCEVGMPDGGTMAELVCHYSACGFGRRPEGLADPAPISGPPLGAFFARAAYVEAASVHAFHRLTDELCAHRAPQSLVDAARRAARDEVRHARIMTSLAGRFGATPPPVGKTARGPRPLAAIAIENAVEGCIGETWSAVVTTWQSRTAADASVRAAMAVISDDETRHAELAAEVDAWLALRLTPAERVQVAAARREAVTELLDRIESPVAPVLATVAGLPPPAAASALAASLTAHLWS